MSTAFIIRNNIWKRYGVSWWVGGVLWSLFFEQKPESKRLEKQNKNNPPPQPKGFVAPSPMMDMLAGVGEEGKRRAENRLPPLTYRVRETKKTETQDP